MTSGMLALSLLVAVAGPAYYFWRESRLRDPALRWRAAAEDLRLEFKAPASLIGRWNEREMAWRVEAEGAALSCRFVPSRPVRLEIGLKEDVERRAGIVVPDRVAFADPSGSDFEERFLARCQPAELGPALVDAVVRRKIAGFPFVRVVAAEGSLDLKFPMLLDADRLRAAMEIAVSLAETLEQA